MGGPQHMNPTQLVFSMSLPEHRRLGRPIAFRNGYEERSGVPKKARSAGKLGFQTDKREQKFKDRRELVMAAVKRTLRPEFINRVDELIVFDPLIEEQLCQIARIMIERLNEGLVERKVAISVTDDVCSWLVKMTCQDREYGARPLRRGIQRYIEDALSEELIRGGFPEQGKIEVYLEGDRLAFRSTTVETSSPQQAG